MSTVNTDVYDQLGLSRELDSGYTTRLTQDDFLNLMVTEIQNQDPFKPMEANDMAAQMAQFSTVSGIQDLQYAFWSLADAVYSDQALQASGLVGHSVLVPMDNVNYTAGETVDGAVELFGSSDSVTVGVYDLSGQLIDQIDLGAQEAGLASFSWDGINADGEPVPSGTYEFRAEYSTGTGTEAASVLVSDEVKSVTISQSGGPLTLGLADQGDVDFSDVRQIN